MDSIMDTNEMNRKDYHDHQRRPCLVRYLSEQIDDQHKTLLSVVDMTNNDSDSNKLQANNTNSDKITTTRTTTHSKKKNDWLAYSHDDELFIQQLPKVELHIHLDGSFDPDILWEYIQKEKLKNTTNNNKSNDTVDTIPTTNIPPTSSTVQTTEKSLEQRLPIEFIPPWGDGDTTLHIRKAILHDCTTSHHYRDLCTCRGYRSLSSMLNCFQYFLPVVTGQIQLIEQLSHDFVYRQYEQNIIYTEVRYSPHLLASTTSSSTTSNSSGSCSDSTTDDGVITAKMVIDAVTAGLRRGIDDITSNNQNACIVINQILCAITWYPEWANDIVSLANEYRTNYPCAVVGIDVAAGEEHYDSMHYPHLYKPHYDMCQEAIKLNIPLTIHAGEIGSTTTSTSSCIDANENTNDTEDKNIDTKKEENNEDDNIRKSNVRLAIDEYGARRIGHGYRIVNDPDLIEYCKNRGVHFEMCPTSSYETGGWDYCNINDNTIQHQEIDRPDWTLHPLALFHKQYGITNVSINSDDPAVFHTSLSWQYRIALCKMKQFTRTDFIVMNIQALDAAFGLSNQQRIDLQQQLYSFAIDWGIDIVHFDTNNKTEMERVTEESKGVATPTQTTNAMTTTKASTTGHLTDVEDSMVYASDQGHRKLQKQHRYDAHAKSSKTFAPSPSIIYRKAQSSDSIFRDRVYINNIKM